MGDSLFALSMIFAVVFGAGAIIIFLSDVVVDFWNRSTPVDDVPAYFSQRAGTEWQREAGSTFPGDPARCPICLDVASGFVRGHTQLVCHSCARLSPREVALIRSYQVPS